MLIMKGRPFSELPTADASEQTLQQFHPLPFSQPGHETIAQFLCVSRCVGMWALLFGLAILTVHVLQCYSVAHGISSRF